MAARGIRERRSIWERKPVLRTVYADYAARIHSACRDGRTLEIGAGGAGIGRVSRETVVLDIEPAPWLSVAGDAQALPFADATFDNIVMIDALHHFPLPRRFFAEAARVLRPGGRIVMIEPAVTLLTWPIYRFCHHEPLDMRSDPLSEVPLSGAAPDDANQAIPSLIFLANRRRLEDAFPCFAVTQIRRFGFLAFPLSGGYRRWSLLSPGAAGVLLRLERRIERWCGRLGLRLFVVVERRT